MKISKFTGRLANAIWLVVGRIIPKQAPVWEPVLVAVKLELLGLAAAQVSAASDGQGGQTNQGAKAGGAGTRFG